MGDSPVVTTPNTTRYELRSRTPTTPNTPATPTKERIIRSTSTPITSERLQRHTSTPGNSPCTPIQRVLRTAGTPTSTSSREKLVFRTPMAFKPRIVGNKAVPSPSRPELWKQQLGLSDDPSCSSDKENSSSEDEENQKCQTSLVEYRALQKVLAKQTAQRDDTLLQIKTYKDKIRQYKTRLERDENTKRQQMKIMRKTHETQIQDKDQLLDNLQSVIQEQEDRIHELENNIVTTPRTRRKQQTQQPLPPPPPKSEGTNKLIEDIKRLHTEKNTLTTQLDEVQLELSNLREDTTREISSLKDAVIHNDVGPNCDDSVRSTRSNHTVQWQPCSTDTEKQVEVLQADNEQLLQDLTDTKNAHTKAITVSKLSNHRQQQLEDEVKRLKQKVMQLEEAAMVSAEKCSDLLTLQQEVTSQGEVKVKLEDQVRSLQAEIFTLQAKSPEVVKVTKVKEVESEELKRRYEECKVELHKLKVGQREEIQETQAQNKYLERMLNVTQSEKAESDSLLWKELDSLNTEHQATLKHVRLALEQEKHDALKKLDEIQCKEREDALKKVQETAEKMAHLITEHHINLKQVKLNMEHDKQDALTKLEEQLSKDNGLVAKKCEEEMEVKIASLSSEHEVALTHVKTDMEHNKQESLQKLENRLTYEHKKQLHDFQENLKTKHKAEIGQLMEEREMAIQHVWDETADKMADLETRYEGLVSQLSIFNSIISGFVESYILLEKEVRKFPHIIEKTVNKVKKEMTAAIVGISEYNKELVDKYQKQMKLRKKYHNELVRLKGNIRVFCRVRPPIKEDGQGQQAEKVVTFDPDDDGVIYVSCKGRVQTFDLDKVFSENSTQDQVFDEVKDLVMSCVDGYNVCIFAYGQTGSGKTFTMEGTAESPGINQRALGLLFEEIRSRDVDWNYTITVSVIEIYNEMIRDLLGEDTSYKMEVKMNPDGGVHIPGLSYVTVNTVHDVNECFRVGQQNRATASTNMNEHSSRSHALLSVTVIGVNKTTGSKTTGRLNLVDLAGSERVSKSKADGARLKEAQKINMSLLCLGDVISALRAKQSFIPYRNSKLTYLLQDSLGGDSKTLMITQIAPVRKNEGETICSLNFAQRVRNVELGTATRKLDNGDGTEDFQDDLKSGDYSSPARTVSTPQSKLTSTPQSRSLQPRGNTTPSSSSKLTPVSRQTRKK